MVNYSKLIGGDSLAPAFYYHAESVKKSDTTPLREVVEIVRVSSLAQLPDVVAYIDISSICDGGYVSHYQSIQSADIPARARFRVRVGDVLLSTSVSNRLDVAIVPPILDGALCSNSLAVLRPKLTSSFAIWSFLRTGEAGLWAGLLSPGVLIPRESLEKIPMPSQLMNQQNPISLMEVLDNLASPHSEEEFFDHFLGLSDLWGFNLWEYEIYGGAFVTERSNLTDAFLNPGLQIGRAHV